MDPLPLPWTWPFPTPPSVRETLDLSIMIFVFQNTDTFYLPPPLPLDLTVIISTVYSLTTSTPLFIYFPNSGCPSISPRSTSSHSSLTHTSRFFGFHNSAPRSLLRWDRCVKLVCMMVHLNRKYMTHSLKILFNHDKGVSSLSFTPVKILENPSKIWLTIRIWILPVGPILCPSHPFCSQLT